MDREKNLPLDPEKMRAEKKELYDKLILTDLKLKPGADNLINSLLDQYQLCIASASRRLSLDLISDKFNFTSRFKKIISDQEAHIKRLKPYPDVLLHVAKVMNVLPKECLVIEDSFAGLKAAKSAKMKCIVCPDSFCEIKTLDQFKTADKIVKSLNEIDIKMIHQLDKN